MGYSSRQRLKDLKEKVIGVTDLLNYQDGARDDYPFRV